MWHLEPWHVYEQRLAELVHWNWHLALIMLLGFGQIIKCLHTINSNLVALYLEAEKIADQLRESRSKQP
jgi:hypothetical protein